MSLPIRQLAWFSILVALGLAAVSFGRVTLEAYQLGLQRQQLQGEVSALQTENRQLKARVDDLQTDSAIERLARQELGWTRPGDVLVIVSGQRPAPGSEAPKRN